MARLLKSHHFQKADLLRGLEVLPIALLDDMAVLEDIDKSLASTSERSCVMTMVVLFRRQALLASKTSSLEVASRAEIASSARGSSLPGE